MRLPQQLVECVINFLPNYPKSSSNTSSTFSLTTPGCSSPRLLSRRRGCPDPDITSLARSPSIPATPGNGFPRFLVQTMSSVSFAHSLQQRPSNTVPVHFSSQSVKTLPITSLYPCGFELGSLIRHYPPRDFLVFTSLVLFRSEGDICPWLGTSPDFLAIQRRRSHLTHDRGPD